MSVRSLHVITSDARRGAETHAAQLVDHLRAAGDEAEVVALVSSRSENPHAVVTLGGSRVTPAAIARLRRAAGEADVVVAHGSACLPVTALALIGTRTPFVYRSIGDPRFWQSSRSRRLRSRLGLRRAAHVVALWDGAAEAWRELHGIDESRITVIPNAVAADGLAPAVPAERDAARTRFDVPPGVPCIAFIGALSSEKDPLRAVDTAALLPEAHLLVAGTGPLAEQLRARASTMRGRVHLLGQLSDVRPVLAAADVLLVPSRTEGQPGVIIEAALSGVPVVATAVGGVPALFRRGALGQLVEERSGPWELAEAVRRCVASPPEAWSPTTIAYVFDSMGPAWRSLLASVAEGNQSRHL